MYPHSFYSRLNCQPYHSDSPVHFDGVLPNYALSELSEKHFVHVPAGESVTSTFELAEIFDLTEGGEYTVSTKGFMSFADSTGKGLKGGAHYESNQLKITVDGAEASKVPKALKALDKRTYVSSGCTGSYGSALLTALDNAVGIAASAAQAALQDDSLFQEFFGTLDQGARQTVAARFNAVSQEASSTNGGATDYYCQDQYGYCTDGVLAYTLPAYNIIVNCPLYYSYLPPLAGGCGQQGQAMATIHEMTHAPGVYSPGTVDHGYGYDACVSLSTQDALNSAGCYGIFAVSKFYTFLEIERTSPTSLLMVIVRICANEIDCRQPAQLLKGACCFPDDCLKGENTASIIIPVDTRWNTTICI